MVPVLQWLQIPRPTGNLPIPAFYWGRYSSSSPHRDLYRYPPSRQALPVFLSSLPFSCQSASHFTDMANPLRRIHCHGGRPCRRLASRGGPINSTFSHRASSSPLRAAEPSSPRWSSHSSVPGPQSVAAPQIGRLSTPPLTLLGIGLGLLAGAVAGWAFSTSDRKQGSAKPQYATIAQMEQAITEVQRALGEDSVSTDSEILLAHGYSEWSTVNIDRLPVAVVFPSSTEEVSTVAKICHKYNIPISKYYEWWSLNLSSIHRCFTERMWRRSH